MSRKKLAIIYSLTLIVFIADRAIKNFLISNPGYSRDFVFLIFHLIKNRGMAFGLTLEQLNFNLVMIVLTVLIIIGLFVYIHKNYKQENYLASTWLAIIILGAVSNLIDRLHYGGVIDYLDLVSFGKTIWPVFNLADVLIVIGIVGIGSRIFKSK